jgi:hypothetical protein
MWIGWRRYGKHTEFWRRNSLINPPGRPRSRRINNIEMNQVNKETGCEDRMLIKI